eukprot:EG_transcript_41750
MRMGRAGLHDLWRPCVSNIFCPLTPPGRERAEHDTKPDDLALNEHARNFGVGFWFRAIPPSEPFCFKQRPGLAQPICVCPPLPPLQRPMAGCVRSGRPALLGRRPPPTSTL